MKRSIDEGQPSNASKKQKTDNSVVGVSGAAGTADGGGEWTRVEKRKVKKAKKHETKLDVRSYHCEQEGRLNLILDQAE